MGRTMTRRLLFWIAHINTEEEKKNQNKAEAVIGLRSVSQLVIYWGYTVYFHGKFVSNPDCDSSWQWSLSAHLVQEDTLDPAHLMNQRIKAMHSGKEAQPSKGGASEPRHFCASCTRDLVCACLRRSRNTLRSCSASFIGRVRQGRCWVWSS